MSTTTAMIDPERQMLGEVEVIGRERWEEIRRRASEGASIRRIARGWIWIGRPCVAACGKRSGSRTSGRHGSTRCWPPTRSTCDGGRPSRGRLLGPGAVEERWVTIDLDSTDDRTHGAQQLCRASAHGVR